MLHLCPSLVLPHLHGKENADFKNKIIQAVKTWNFWASKIWWAEFLWVFPCFSGRQNSWGFFYRNHFFFIFFLLSLFPILILIVRAHFFLFSIWTEIVSEHFWVCRKIEFSPETMQYQITGVLWNESNSVYDNETSTTKVLEGTVFAADKTQEPTGWAR